MLALITGTGFETFADLERPEPLEVPTPYGTAEIVRARWRGREIAWIPRHGRGHRLLPHRLEYRSRFWALRELKVTAILGTSVVGLLDPELSLGVPVLFDELYFPENRLPDGSLCSLYREADPDQGHFIPSSIFSPRLRAAVQDAAQALGLPLHSTGTYAHVNGPRLNTPGEIRALRALGVTAVSQTAGPEAVLAGEIEVPYALLGFPVDHAAGVSDPTPAEVLRGHLARSPRVLGRILGGALERLPEGPLPQDTGFVFRIGG